MSLHTTPTQAQAWKTPGFGPHTRIRTTIGDIPAGLLRRGDEVITPSGVSCPILWIDRLGLDDQFLAHNPEARPVVLRAGALGPDLPAADLTVSRQQTVYTDGSKAGITLTKHDKPTSDPDLVEGGFQYTVFHCGRPVRVLAEGLWCQVDELSSTRGRYIA